GDDNQTYVWRTADGSLVHKLQSGGRSVWGVGWSRDGKSIAWGNTNGAGTLTGTTRLERTFRIGDLDFGTPPTPDFLRQPAEVNGYTLHGLDFFRIAIKRHGAQIHVFQAPLKGDRLYSAALIGDDRAAFGGSFGTIYIVDLKTNQIRYQLDGHASMILGLSPSPDGRFLLSGGSDQTMCLWNLQKLGRVPLMTLFVTGPHWIAWTPEGYYAASPHGERLM